jgi:hypothetical protein
MSKPKGPKARFTSKEQIIAQIDKFTSKRDKKHTQAAQLLHDCKELRRMMANPECTSGASFRVEADAKYARAQRIGKQIKRLEEKVLPMWKHKLSEFQTDVIPGFLPDNSVEAPE